MSSTVRRVWEGPVWERTRALPLAVWGLLCFRRIINLLLHLLVFSFESAFHHYRFMARGGVKGPYAMDTSFEHADATRLQRICTYIAAVVHQLCYGFIMGFRLRPPRAALSQPVLTREELHSVLLRYVLDVCAHRLERARNLREHLHAVCSLF